MPHNIPSRKKFFFWKKLFLPRMYQQSLNFGRRHFMQKRKILTIFYILMQVYSFLKLQFEDYPQRSGVVFFKETYLKLLMKQKHLITSDLIGVLRMPLTHTLKLFPDPFFVYKRIIISLFLHGSVQTRLIHQKAFSIFRRLKGCNSFLNQFLK